MSIADKPLPTSHPNLNAMIVETPSKDNNSCAYEGTESRLSIFMVKGEQGFLELREEWKQLWLQSEEAADTQTWEWQYLYWRLLAPNKNPIIIIVRDVHGNCLALTAMFVCCNRNTWIPKTVFLGDKRADYHQILAMPDLRHTVGSKLFEFCLRHFRFRTSLIELNNIPEASYTASCLKNALTGFKISGGLKREWFTKTFAIELPALVEEYESRLGPRSRRDYHYQCRRLEKEYDVALRVYRERSGLEEALDAIEEIDRKRWKTNSQYCVFRQRRFERELAAAYCRMGIYRAHVLYLDGKPASYITGAIVRNRYRVRSIGYDPSVPQKFSIGKVANFHVITQCIREGVEEYDLTRGDENYKSWLGANVHTNRHVRIYRSPLDKILVSCGEKAAGYMGNVQWVRQAYQRFLRK